MSLSSNELLALSSTQTLLIDFWAPWCEPCFVLEPILDELAAENENRWQLLKINIDENAALAEYFGIRSVPTVILLGNSEIKGRYTGLMWKKQYAEWITEKLSDNI